MLNHLSMAYLLSNICAKNYWNWITTTVEIIIGGWVVSFFRDTVYVKQYIVKTNFYYNCCAASTG